MFGNLGALAKIGELKEKMEELKVKLEATEVTGSSSDAMVSVTMNATKKKLVDVTIKPELVAENDAEKLEDAVFNALQDTFTKCDEVSKKEGADVKKLMPPGFEKFLGAK